MQKVDLKIGLGWLEEAIAYPLKHDVSEKEAKLIADLLLEFDVIDDEKYAWMLEDDE